MAHISFMLLAILEAEKYFSKNNCFLLFHESMDPKGKWLNQSSFASLSEKGKALALFTILGTEIGHLYPFAVPRC